MGAEKGIALYIAKYNSEGSHLSLKEKTPDAPYHIQPAALPA